MPLYLIEARKWALCDHDHVITYSSHTLPEAQSIAVGLSKLGFTGRIIEAAHPRKHSPTIQQF